MTRKRNKINSAEATKVSSSIICVRVHLVAPSLSNSTCNFCGRLTRNLACLVFICSRDIRRWRIFRSIKLAVSADGKSSLAAHSTRAETSCRHVFTRARTEDSPFGYSPLVRRTTQTSSRRRKLKNVAGSRKKVAHFVTSQAMCSHLLMCCSRELAFLWPLLVPFRAISTRCSYTPY